jgi:SAM-dependent methyltransferase
MRQTYSQVQQGAWFEEWFNSPYYPLLYGHRDEREAQSFVDQILSLLDPAPGARILDLACGQGRLARQLASRGYEVIGVDISENAIAIAKQSEQDNLHFFQHDMRKTFRFGYFDFIFNFFTSFGYFEHDDDHLDTLRAVRQGLGRKGQFVLDYLNTVKVRAGLVKENTIMTGDVRFKLNRRFEEGYFVKDIDITDGASHMYFQERVRGFTLPELESLFSEAGLHIRHIFGDYHLAPYEEGTSERLILVAEKE